MQVTLLRAKLHRACVTHTDPHSEDAFAIDGDLLDLAGINEFEQLQIYNASSGERFTSHVIRAEHGSRIVSADGAAGRKASVGDRLSICAYADMNTHEVSRCKPVLIYCDDENHVTGAANVIPMQLVS